MTGKINFGINFVSWTLCKSYSVHDRYLFAWLNLHEIMIRKSKKIGHRCFSPRFSHLETWIFHFRLGQKPRGAGTCNGWASSSNRNLKVYFINVYNFTPKFELRLIAKFLVYFIISFSSICFVRKISRGLNFLAWERRRISGCRCRKYVFLVGSIFGGFSAYSDMFNEERPINPDISKKLTSYRWP